MAKKNLPRYKSSKYFAKFKIDWIDESTGYWSHEKEGELIELFKDNCELTPDSKVSIKYKYLSQKEKEVYWKRATREGKEKVILGELEPDEEFLRFLEKFFKRWYGGYRKTSYCIMKAICKFYQKNPDKFKEFTDKARNLQEFIALMGIS